MSSGKSGWRERDASPACGVLLDPGPHDLLHESNGDRLIQPEAERPLPGEVGLQLFPVSLQDRFARRIEAPVVLERRVPDEHAALEPECRHLVADRLGRFGGSGLDRRAKLFHGGARWLGKGRHVVLDGLGYSQRSLLVKSSLPGRVDLTYPSGSWRHAPDAVRRSRARLASARPVAWSCARPYRHAKSESS